MNLAGYVFAFVLSLNLLGMLLLIDPIQIACQRLLGRRRIWVEGASYDSQDDFYTIIRVSPTGKMWAYRYVATRTGKVSLKEDGTGEYCGSIRWIYA